MSEARGMLVETADRLFAGLAGSSPAFTETWSVVAEAGFDTLLMSEEDGGFGGDWGDLFAVARLAGCHAVAAPVGEAAIATWAVRTAGLGPVQGLTTIAPSLAGRIEGEAFTGTLQGVPWGGDADAVAAILDGRVIRVAVGDAVISRGFSPAGEPRDALTFDSAPVSVGAADTDVFAAGALLRTAQIAGALDAALAASIAYANERVQFGKPISKFQTVQQNLAVLAVEAAAVNSAGQGAARAADAGDAGLEIAAAKLRANQAAGTGAALAHQVHGAIGFTREYPLHPLTRRLIGWRSEFGGDRLWAERLGRRVARLGADGLWPELTRRSDAADVSAGGTDA